MAQDYITLHVYNTHTHNVYFVKHNRKDIGRTYHGVTERQFKELLYKSQ